MSRLFVAVLLALSIVSTVTEKVSSRHNYLLGGSAYQASWNPRFSGWRSTGLGGWGSRGWGWGGLGGWGRRSAYATSWLPGFSGWGRRYHNLAHETETDEKDHKLIDPTWHPNFSGFQGW